METDNNSSWNNNDNFSILNSIKKLLGIFKTNTDFDADIIIHINTVFMILNQLGVGKDNFRIEDATSTWNEFIDEDEISATKSYVYMKVKLLFDPPINGALMESLKESIREYEWRLNVKAETDDKEV